VFVLILQLKVTSVHYAAQHGNADMVKVLKEYGANVCCQDVVSFLAYNVESLLSHRYIAQYIKYFLSIKCSCNSSVQLCL